MHIFRTYLSYAKVSIQQMNFHPLAYFNLRFKWIVWTVCDWATIFPYSPCPVRHARVYYCLCEQALGISSRLVCSNCFFTERPGHMTLNTRPVHILYKHRNQLCNVNIITVIISLRIRADKPRQCELGSVCYSICLSLMHLS